VIPYKKKVFDAEEIFEETKWYMKTNPHGFSLHAVSRDKEYVYRTIVAEEYIDEIKKLKELRLFHTHYRFATQGSISVDNTHMFPIVINDKTYYLSHNGSVFEFMDHSEYYYYFYHYLKHEKNNSEKKVIETKDNRSDTRKMAEDPRFHKALKDLLNEKPKKFVKYLFSKGFYGVMFITSKDKIIAVSKDKPIQIYLYRDLLYMSNTDLALAKVKFLTKYIILRKTTYHGEIENAIIVIDYSDKVDKIKVIKFRRKPKDLIRKRVVYDDSFDRVIFYKVIDF
jgi:predicted glutamine amidotransferase